MKSSVDVSGKLAIDGGSAVNVEAFPAWPVFSEKTYQMLSEPLRTARLNYWSGPYGKKFEAELAAWHQARYCVTTVNEHGAFHLALASLGVAPGDEVICPSYIYFPPIFSILQLGALPVFSDVDCSHTLDPNVIEEKITDRTKAIIVAHMYGIVADMGAIMAIARKHGLRVLEDCTECFGGLYKGKKTGTVGDVGCFNLCHTKHLVTGGEGGAVITDNPDIHQACFSLRDYGFDTSDGFDMIKAEQQRLYVHNRIGSNYRMTEIQSLIGSCELERMDSWNLPIRRRNGQYLIDALKDHPLVLHTPYDSEERQNSFWWAPFVLDLERLNVSLKQFLAAMGAEGVPVYGPLWPELYKEEVLRAKRGCGSDNYPFNTPAAAKMDYANIECPTAKWLAERTISFFAHPNYEISHLEKYVAAFNKVAKAYMK
ncbi:MAG: DegT/DnrJ/EryC1/StrS family aminotransferase [Lentisphaerae bacterium]|jgi:dTDP-4-amino-4,6-dideoxygalactose transaminase|nr:DegT/DnrJ/EryC1/StrS family aminotransferase [Lentisphaerota bacterium]